MAMSVIALIALAVLAVSDGRREDRVVRKAETHDEKERLQRGLARRGEADLHRGGPGYHGQLRQLRTPGNVLENLQIFAIFEICNTWNVSKG